jgi:hypothetical protein
MLFNIQEEYWFTKTRLHVRSMKFKNLNNASIRVTCWYVKMLPDVALMQFAETGQAVRPSSSSWKSGCHNPNSCNISSLLVLTWITKIQDENFNWIFTSLSWNYRCIHLLQRKCSFLAYSPSTESRVVVSIMLGYGLDGQGLIPGRGRFSLLPSIQTSSGTH